MPNTALSEFDALTGGLTPGGQYLVYGAASSGKSTFGLGFLAAGLGAGESGLLITDRPPRQVLLHARAFGYELEDAVREGRLILFEYPENVSENLATLIDDGRVARELRAMIGERMVQRVVFDPLTPLLDGAHRESSSERVKALARSLAEQGTTGIYVLDLPQGAQYMASCRESIAAALKFEAAAGGDSFSARLEGFPRREGAVAQFRLVAGKGFVRSAGSHEFLDSRQEARALPEAQIRFLPPPPRPAETPAQEWSERTPRVLVLEPDRSRRAWLGSVFGSDHRLIEAQSAAEGLALAASEEPDAIVVNQDLKGVTGKEVVRRLRSSGRKQPIVVIGERVGRTSDRIETMLAGADACFSLPVDSRLLRLSLSGLMSWPVRERVTQIEGGDAFRSPQRDRVAYTSDSSYFLKRCEYEAEWASDLAVPFSIVSMRLPASASVDDLASTSAILTRGSDLILAAPRGLLVLLTEATSEEAFLGRFRCRWTGSYKPTVEVLRFERQQGFNGLVKSLIAGVSDLLPVAMRGAAHVAQGAMQ